MTNFLKWASTFHNCKHRLPDLLAVWITSRPEHWAAIFALIRHAQNIDASNQACSESEHRCIYVYMILLWSTELTAG